VSYNNVENGIKHFKIFYHQKITDNILAIIQRNNLTG